jgi:hypothetical protein
MAESMHIIADEVLPMISQVKQDIELVSVRTKGYVNYIANAYQFTNIAILGDLLSTVNEMGKKLEQLERDGGVFDTAERGVKADVEIAKKLEAGAGEYGARFKRS